MMRLNSLLLPVICVIILTSAGATTEATHFVYLPLIVKSKDGESARIIS